MIMMMMIFIQTSLAGANSLCESIGKGKTSMAIVKWATLENKGIEYCPLAKEYVKCNN